MNNILRAIFAVGIISSLFSLIVLAQKPAMVTTVILTCGNDQANCEMVQNRLTDILNSLNKLENVSLSFTADGLRSFTELLNKTGFKCVNVLYEGRLLNLPEGGFEVRGIRVRVEMGNTKGNPDQYLVFTLNTESLISNVRFSMESHHYQRIIEDGVRLKDFAYRQKILHFIEIFRTAYNRKDIEYLRKAYSDNALIIVGRVLQVAPEQTDMIGNSFLTRDQIQFVKLSKAQYLKNLEHVFHSNDFLKVDFEELEIIRHGMINDIYGITLKQRWRSSNYSDEGYLFLMIDFADEDHPLIHVRTWQPEKFPDGSVISLYDFNIIE